MSVIYLMIPLAIALAAAALWGFVWSVRRGQLDDLDTPPLRVLFDEDDDASISNESGARMNHEGAKTRRKT